MTLPLTYSDEVRAALDAGKPVVALESTIITHGMPYPANLETARGVEDVVRDNGAVPATIAIIDHEIHIGLSAERLEWLAQAKDVMKLSRADLAFAVAHGRTGATTVAATMICAALAGISVFATGGIGGVHKGAEDTFDISADLLELAQTPVTVVCAGAKAILDLPMTMEVLETNGVPVIGYQTDVLPAFWSRESDIAIPLRSDTAAAIAAAHQMRATLGLKGGQLVANPIPTEAELSRAYLEPIIAQAVSEAEAQGIAAKGVTPFLLGRIVELTEGKSLTANIALVRNNAKLASEIAVSLA
ncbi:pseudouridine-5'-phosphate glycosidase [Amylibacter sp. IMCC11727]|uniref:pseudouridine-5'-phosphate glycosidase n=1 Tax=Amylibacter sp. IMCC11727 TaxID=3039851 RepID=UPI00244DE1D5|nr:pseudouridine-5'-phosphate glycosidase [Amylibacter sp. IMCC11727]WGI20379.1 pseudouridine-5'-phosphate glycosidase [Amylibacter sp. IMCC11727]